MTENEIIRKNWGYCWKICNKQCIMSLYFESNLTDRVIAICNKCACHYDTDVQLPNPDKGVIKDITDTKIPCDKCRWSNISCIKDRKHVKYECLGCMARYDNKLLENMIK